MDPTVSTAPWWYVAALAGGFTILGGLITLAGGWLSDRRKLRREDLRQWDKEIREVASACLTAADRLSKTRVEPSNEDDGNSSLIIPPKYRLAHDEASAALALNYQHLAIIASDTTLHTLADLHWAANEVSLVDYKSKKDASITYSALLDKMGDARGGFIEAIRRDIRRN